MTPTPLPTTIPTATLAPVPSTLRPVAMGLSRPLELTSVTVWRLADGGIVAVTLDGQNVTLRLIGLDTPATVDPRKPVQCFGREASAIFT
ncbi:MAG: hypothetical protein HY329_06665 [Chloroflexi bacterium]|nr:hypothetical protein [Chloroflexota bacterium]